jgi:hypothetical protein
MQTLTYIKCRNIPDNEKIKNNLKHANGYVQTTLYKNPIPQCIKVSTRNNSFVLKILNDRTRDYSL